MSNLTGLEAIVIGSLQGVAELFPVSSLGHSILLPAVIGGSWARDLDVSAPESPYLAFVVGLHVATALALLIYFRHDWVRIVRGLATSVARREVTEPDQRLGWLLVLATIPVGLAGLLLEHTFRVYLSNPVPTALFLIANGLVLLLGERLRRRSAVTGVDRATEVLPVVPGGGVSVEQAADQRLARLPLGRAVTIGAAQVAALAPGVSRSGAAMVTGLVRGLSHADAALLVPARYPGHPRRGGPQAGRPRRALGRRHPAADPDREPPVRYRGLRLGAVPDPLLRDPLPASVRRVLHRRRPGLPALVLDPVRQKQSGPLTCGPARTVTAKKSRQSATR